MWCVCLLSLFVVVVVAAAAAVCYLTAGRSGFAAWSRLETVELLSD